MSFINSFSLDFYLGHAFIFGGGGCLTHLKGDRVGIFQATSTDQEINLIYA